MKEIPLTKGKVALVDDADYNWLMLWKWTTKESSNTFYAYRKSKKREGKKRNIKMHRVILNITDINQLGDHKDGNGLNNQRSNLRVATYSENNINKRPRKNKSSKYKGVMWDNFSNKWIARIQKDKKIIHIDRFVHEEEAAIAYNLKASELFGEFAVYNNIV